MVEYAAAHEDRASLHHSGSPPSTYYYLVKLGGKLLAFHGRRVTGPSRPLFLLLTRCSFCCTHDGTGVPTGPPPASNRTRLFPAQAREGREGGRGAVEDGATTCAIGIGWERLAARRRALHRHRDRVTRVVVVPAAASTSPPRVSSAARPPQLLLHTRGGLLVAQHDGRARCARGRREHGGVLDDARLAGGPARARRAAHDAARAAAAHAQPLSVRARRRRRARALGARHGVDPARAALAGDASRRATRRLLAGFWFVNEATRGAASSLSSSRCGGSPTSGARVTLKGAAVGPHRCRTRRVVSGWWGSG